MKGKLNPDVIKKMGEKGSSLFSLLTPDKKSIIISTVSSYAKIRNSSSVTLLGISTPLVLDAIGQHGNNKNSDSAELMNFLSDQKEAYSTETGEVLLEKSVEVLGLKEYLNAGNSIVAQTTKTQTINFEESNNNSSETSPLNVKNIIIGLIALMVVGAAIFLFLNRNTTDDTNPNTQEEVVVNPSDTLTSVVDTSVVAPVAIKDTTSGTEITPKVTLPPVVAPQVPAITGLTKGGTADLLATYLADTASAKGKLFSYGNLEFDPASTNLSIASGTKIDELIKVLNKYPNAQIKIVGYVGKTADSLKARSLSFKRANAVKLLIASKGINIVRLDAEGKGRSTSVPRIDFRLIKK
jgi:outer membrane protein OmpA-like peptidoglycan-associated protein